MEYGRDGADRQPECLLHLLPHHRVQFGCPRPVGQGRAEDIGGFGEGEGVDGIQLLPVGQPCLQDLVNGGLDLLGEVVECARSLPPHFNAQVAVGILPSQRWDTLVSKAWREGFDVATPSARVDDGEAPTLPDVEGEARPLAELVNDEQHPLQLCLGWSDKGDVISEHELLDSAAILQSVASGAGVECGQEGL